jgi:ribosomal protein S18 acetylase RimI-like enzyme
VSFRIRKAVPEDAQGITEVVSDVARERIHSAITEGWHAKKQRDFMLGQTAREAVFVALGEDDEVIACQFLDLYSSILPAMSHVASIGTFVRPTHRGHGLGKQLWRATKAYAVVNGYTKAAIQVRGSNLAAQGYYKSLGFQECGRMKGQVIIDGAPDDEVLFEMFF